MLPDLYYMILNYSGSNYQFPAELIPEIFNSKLFSTVNRKQNSPSSAFSPESLLIATAVNLQVAVQIEIVKNEVLPVQSIETEIKNFLRGVHCGKYQSR